MTYYEIVKSAEGTKDAMWKAVHRISEFLEKSATLSPGMTKEVEILKMETHGDMLGGHFSEDTSKYALDKMKPVVLMHEGSPVNSTMWDYMYDTGLTPTEVSKAVDGSYTKAKEALAKLGKQAPLVSPKYTEWDKFVTMAMVLADNPMTISGDISKGAMLTYEYLSDPDSEDDKIWEYIIH